MSKRKQTIYRYLAFFMAINILAEVVSPTLAMALTGGPSQPEVESFEPVGTSDMVDVFSGDFNYNIPLLNVPGPNGGYPINLAYHAGIGMEQEASYVGLGWNINPGVINRQMRGLPDDFNGEVVKKEITHRPNWTFGLGMETSKDLLKALGLKEIFGLELEKLGLKVASKSSHEYFYNNYKGLGINYSKGISAEFNAFGDKLKVEPNAGYSIGTQSGIGLEGSLSMSGKIKNANYSFNTSFGYNSRSGLYSLSVNANLNPKFKSKILNGINTLRNLALPSGINFFGTTSPPASTVSLYGMSAKIKLKLGGTSNILGKFNGKELFGNYSRQWVEDAIKDYQAYGFNYLQNKSGNGLMDYNKGNDFPVNKNTPALPTSQATNDVYSISGQGTGGVFRPFRSDIGIFTDPSVSGKTYGGVVGIEVGGAAAQHFGIDAAALWSENYSGEWTANTGDLNGFNFHKIGEGGADNLFEPFYYKTAGELTADEDYNNEIDRFGGFGDPVKLRLGLEMNGTVLEPKVYNQRTKGNKALQYNTRKHREKRNQGIEYKTFEQVKDNERYNNRAKNLWIGASNTWNEAPSNYAAYDFSYDDFYNTENPKGTQTATMSVVNPDGNRYEYALPAYNTLHKDVLFTTGKAVGQPGNTTRKTINYGDEGKSSSKNKEGADHFFSSTTIPEYAHAYMLTAIYSPDYVDLTGNGPSKDDLGYYVKFNYIDNGKEKWRSPYFDANFSPGAYSNNLDDKAYYAYGEKKVYYVHSIETKTHVALFQLSDRTDAFGAVDEHLQSADLNSVDLPSTSAYRQKKLDKIVLYSKLDLNTAIKTVNFEYNYSLCPGAPNNSNTQTFYEVNTGNTNSTPKIPTNGKLTLKKVWFQYMNNSKGKLSPYVFEYNESKYPSNKAGTNDGVSSDEVQNPCYNLSQTDRWGYYKEDDLLVGTNATNESDPYVRQDDKARQDRYMSVWNLKKITLPSGGDININYESDDYAYVQDQAAMQMFRILGTGKTDGSSTYATNFLKDGYYRIYFDLSKEKSGKLITDINKYINGISHLYFKAYTELKKKPDFSAVAYDYVDGFCQIEPSMCGTQQLGNQLCGYITVKEVPVAKKAGHTHPFRKAAWEYLKNKRPDLLFPMDITDFSSGAKAFLFSFVSLIKERIRTLTGYFNFCKISGIASKLKLDDTYHPSFIRLNTPGQIKFGGGHRVKELTVTDNWSAMSSNNEADFNYGQQYEYTMPDGTSSGVADYEPQVGAEEIPHHLPSDKFKSRDFVFASKDLYLIKPYNEAYYPSASVGYRRVVVKSKNGTGSENKSATASGITVYEFYTSKEFPVKPLETEVSRKKFIFGLPIPFVGLYSTNNVGYTQGYSLELNDMHGKLHTVSTYPYEVDINNPVVEPVSRTENIYQTENPFDPNAVNRLNNEVQVLDGNKQLRTTNMGITSDFFISMEENMHVSNEIGGEGNVDIQTLVFTPTFWPDYNFSQNLYRAVVTTRIIYRTAILKKVINSKDGAQAISENRVFDSETGQPVLTSVTNNFDAPVYTYNYPAHWMYPGMRGQYKNIGFEGNITVSSGGIYSVGTVTNLANYFMPGDEVTLKSNGTLKNYWVSATNPFALINEAGQAPPIGSYAFSIVRSGYRNQQSVSAGKVVTLNPDFNRLNLPYIDAINKALSDRNFNLKSNTDGTNSFSINYTDCNGLNVNRDLVVIGLNSPIVSIKLNGIGSCEARSLTIDPGEAVTLSLLKKIQFRIKELASGNYQLVCYNVNSPSVEFNITTINYNSKSCWGACNEGVLHAEAYKFKDNFAGAFDYADIGDPLVNTGTKLSTASTSNPYRYGAKGIWRTWKNYVYQVNREQTDLITNKHTDIAKDGVYKYFTEHNWNTNYESTGKPEEWSFVSEVTRYNPYGFETENRDALNLYSAALYGYNNAMPVAVAKNSGYFEVAFDGFEDYGNATTYPSSGDAWHGHWKFNGSATLNLSAQAHTGSKSLELNPANTFSYIAVDIIDGTSKKMDGHTYTYFTPRNAATASNGGNTITSNVGSTNTQYQLSLWAKKDNALSPGQEVQITLKNGNTLLNSTISRKTEVEKWQKIDVVFDANGINAFSLEIKNTGGAKIFIDDIRIQPLRSAMTTYVYHPKTLWLLAELDDRNYATFYNYDQEGALVQVKKETEKGVMSIKTTRNNTKRLANP